MLLQGIYNQPQSEIVTQAQPEASGPPPRAPFLISLFLSLCNNRDEWSTLPGHNNKMTRIVTTILQYYNDDGD